MVKYNPVPLLTFARPVLHKKVGLFLFLLLTFSIQGYGQAKQHLLQGQRNKLRDSIEVQQDTSVPVIITKIENYAYIIDHTNFLFRNPLNISPIYLELNETEKRLEGFKTRLEQKGKRMNLRSINSGIILLKEIASRLSLHKRTLSNYLGQLSESNAKVKKIISDPTLTLQLKDSILTEQLNDLLIEGRSLDSVQQQITGRVNLLLNHVAVDLLQARDIISDMGYLSTEKKISMWQQEEAPLFQTNAGHYPISLGEVLFTSLQRSGKIISTYLSGKWKVFSVSTLALFFLFFITASNFFKLKGSADGNASLLPIFFLRRNVLMAGLLVYLTACPYFFANPPMSLLHAMELLRFLLLGWLLWPWLARWSKLSYVILYVLWLLFAADDILLESAFGERWLLFLLASSLAAFCIQQLLSRGPYFTGLKEPGGVKTMLSIALALSVLCTGFNLSGRLSLAKISGITAIQTIFLALCLRVFFMIVLEAVYVQFKTVSHRRLSGMFDFKQLTDKAQAIVWLLGSIAWSLSIVRNLTFYDELIKWLDSIINARRSIGNMVFSFRSIGVFILIIWLSFAISNIINFFFGSDTITDIRKKGRIGSLMLIIRLVIWILGFLVGVSAAGIPLDKLSLMVGAFGVGIGFGLQNIVNNLVSGVILAFERPIQVGDSIEVGNKAGIVQEIGVRSSKIENAEGAAIIIPNGDLLSQQLVNWTMHDNSRRLDCLITLSFPSDIDKVRSIVFEELAKNTNILQQPAPAVNIQEFQPNALQVKIMWWIPDLHQAGSVRSAVIQSIYEALNRAGIAFEK